MAVLSVRAHFFVFAFKLDNYLIVFKRSDPLEIIRILHGARDAVRELD